MEIARDYLALERLRFGDRLRTDFDCAVDAATVHVPSLLLQTLVENAVKHGVAPAIAGGDVQIRATPAVAPAGWILIEVLNGGAPGRDADAAVPPSDARRSTGTGLANARERLTLLYGPTSAFHFGRADDGRTVVRFAVSGARHE